MILLIDYFRHFLADIFAIRFHAEADIFAAADIFAIDDIAIIFIIAVISAALSWYYCHFIIEIMIAITDDFLSISPLRFRPPFSFSCHWQLTLMPLSFISPLPPLMPPLLIIAVIIFIIVHFAGWCLHSLIFILPLILPHWYFAATPLFRHYFHITPLFSMSLLFSLLILLTLLLHYCFIIDSCHYFIADELWHCHSIFSLPFRHYCCHSLLLSYAAIIFILLIAISPLPFSPLFRRFLSFSFHFSWCQFSFRYFQLFRHI